MSNCIACGAPLVWIKTLAGKAMPVDHTPVIVTFDPASKLAFVSRTGRVIHGRPLANATDPPTYTDTEKTFLGYPPHWATCPQAQRFRERSNRHANQQPQDRPLPVTD